jgi:DinB superfamily
MNQTETSVKIVLDRWDASIKNLDALLNNLSDATLLREIVPGKNRGIYLIGHLIAVHDDMLRLLDMGEKQYPELFEPFIKTPDNVNTPMPSITDLRKMVNEQSVYLKQKFDKLSANDWYEKHTAVTTEEFNSEPQRNKLNIIVTRTSHLQYHLGQLQLLK